MKRKLEETKEKEEEVEKSAEDPKKPLSVEEVIQMHMNVVQNCKAKAYGDIARRITYSDPAIDLLHGAVGISTEAGEILDQLKKHYFYGNDLDAINLQEELGDLLFYIELMLAALKTNSHTTRLLNVKKLVDKNKGRFKGGEFTEEEAINRDTKKERELLEEDVADNGEQKA